MRYVTQSTFTGNALAGGCENSSFSSSGQALPVCVPEPVPAWVCRDLRVLARTGYWFCHGCGKVTTLVAGRCLRCWGKQLEWCPPVFAPGV